MKESTLSLTTTNPLTAPIRAPQSNVVMIAIGALIPLDSWYETIATEKPITPAIERSKTPAARGTINPIANIAVIAWSPAMIRKLPSVMNVSGIQIANNTMMATQT